MDCFVLFSIQHILLISSSPNNLSACLIISFCVLLLSLKVWQFVTVWFDGLYVYFSIYICNVFNLTIVVLGMGEKFSFCVFWVVVIYRVVFCQYVKYTPYIWVLLCLLSVCVVVFNKIYTRADFAYFYKRYLELYL